MNTQVNIQTGDIWLVKFHPGSGSELSKYRPAVVISDLHKIDSRFSLIAPLTSDTHIKNEYEFAINNSSLEKPSVLLAWYLWTIDKRRLISKLGTLDKHELEPILKNLNALI